MNIVAIDTSGPVVGCAVMMDGEIRQLRSLNSGLTHSETVMPALEDCMRNAELTCDKVDVFAVVAGPGSFTGVRIGVCAAKGLAHAANVPCARIDALETLAMNFFGYDAVICPILDARRGQVYCAAFDTKDGMPQRIMEDSAMALEDFLRALPTDRCLIFNGDGIRVHAEKICSILPNAVIAPAHLAQIRADAACVLAAVRKDEWMEAKQLTPIYLRAPQAERERDRRIRKGEL